MTGIAFIKRSTSEKIKPPLTVLQGSLSRCTAYRNQFLESTIPVKNIQPSCKYKTIKFSFIILHASEHRSVNQTFVRRFQRDINRSVHDFAHRHPYIISYFRNFNCYDRRNLLFLTRKN